MIEALLQEISLPDHLFDNCMLDTAQYSTSHQLSATETYGVPQERRRTVKPLQGKTEFLENKTIKVNPNWGKQGGIPEKESPEIVNNKSDPNGRQK